MKISTEELVALEAIVRWEYEWETGIRGGYMKK
jgi:hypothetical protein